MSPTQHHAPLRARLTAARGETVPTDPETDTEAHSDINAAVGGWVHVGPGAGPYTHTHTLAGCLCPACGETVDKGHPLTWEIHSVDPWSITYTCPGVNEDDE